MGINWNAVTCDEMVVYLTRHDVFNHIVRMLRRAHVGDTTANNIAAIFNDMLSDAQFRGVEVAKKYGIIGMYCETMLMSVWAAMLHMKDS